MAFNAQDAKIVITDPQNDFLSPDGLTWGLVGASVEANGTVGHIRAIVQSPQAEGLRRLHLAPLLLPHRPGLSVWRYRRKHDARNQHVRPQRRS